MIVDVYDLTGALTRTRYEVEERSEKYHFLECISISDVLIEPDKTVCRNQRPYLQERKRPILRDFVQSDGSLDYTNAHLVKDFFQEEAKGDARLEYFFKALHSSSYVDSGNPADWNVILIPDNFSAEYQEKILRNCEFPRQSTVLLWRSVAACLGNMEFLRKNGLEEGMSVYILDEQQAYSDISILKIAATDDGTLVPQRKAYRHSDLYPMHKLIKASPKFYPDNEFYRYTFYGDVGNRIVWDKENKEYSVIRFTERPDNRHNFLPENCRNAEVVLSISASYNLYPSWTGLYHDDLDASSLSDGAALFVARRMAGKPTYFDECTGLYIVVQDIENENIYAKELIAANDRCIGGEIIHGTMNDDCFIKAGTDNVFFLLSEEKGDDVRLKELNYQFKGGCVNKREPLKLYPSIIPGQGIAKVRVEGESQLGAPVELDLLKMAWTEPEKTVNILRREIKHSYPLDMPDVVANERLWRKVEASVKRYMANRKCRNKKMFAKLGPVDPKSEGIERLNRKNVFGYADGGRYPISPAIFDFNALFEYMARDYMLCKQWGKASDMYQVLAMISRTYQGDCKTFFAVKRDVLEAINRCAEGLQNGVNGNIMTACANLFRAGKELTVFFNSYMKVVTRKIANVEDYKVVTYASSVALEKYIDAGNKKKSFVPDIPGVMNWNRVLYGLLVSNNNMLKTIQSDECEKCVDFLMTMLLSQIVHQSSSSISTSFTLKSLLFMLSRRKFDKMFLSSGVVRKNAEKILGIIIEDYSITQHASWAKIVLEFIKGSGTLGGMVAIAKSDESDDNDDDSE